MYDDELPLSPEQRKQGDELIKKYAQHFLDTYGQRIENACTALENLNSSYHGFSDIRRSETAKRFLKECYFHFGIDECVDYLKGYRAAMEKIAWATPDETNGTYMCARNPRVYFRSVSHSLGCLLDPGSAITGPNIKADMTEDCNSTKARDYMRLFFYTDKVEALDRARATLESMTDFFEATNFDKVAGLYCDHRRFHSNNHQDVARQLALNMAEAQKPLKYYEEMLAVREGNFAQLVRRNGSSHSR